LLEEKVTLIVLCVAWTGITVTLLSGGKTAHSQFGLPLNLNQTVVSSLKDNDKITDKRTVVQVH
jgi:hypothetical protein